MHHIGLMGISYNETAGKLAGLVLPQDDIHVDR